MLPKYYRGFALKEAFIYIFFCNNYSRRNMTNSYCRHASNIHLSSALIGESLIWLHRFSFAACVTQTPPFTTSWYPTPSLKKLRCFTSTFFAPFVMQTFSPFCYISRFLSLAKTPLHLLIVISSAVRLQRIVRTALLTLYTVRKGPSSNNFTSASRAGHFVDERGATEQPGH